MQVLSGKSVYEGIATGPIWILKNTDAQVRHKRVKDFEGEILRVKQAQEQSAEQLQQMHKRAVSKVGETGAAIFEVHRVLLLDESYLNAIYARIRSEGVNAEYAVSIIGEKYGEMFANMEDDYMKARVADIRDITRRLIRNLEGRETMKNGPDVPSIILAEDLSPSETVQLDRGKILAIATIRGALNSHTAILARMMNIPALIGVPMNLDELEDGMDAVVDGVLENVMFEPTSEVYQQIRQRMAEEIENRKHLDILKGKQSVTLDGRCVPVRANISCVADIDNALENDAEGVGLFRSEFLYLGKSDFPTEEEQFQAYKRAVQKLNGKKLIIRTLDIGADKQVEYFQLEKEDNPALGYRAIRICLKRPDIFKTQLRALLRAAAYGSLAILYPMIISVREVEAIHEILGAVKSELDAEGISCRMPEQGLMIETPAAVMISDELAELVDFFSIGTNDLTQYTLAIDRKSGYLDEFYEPRHKAIIKMIEMTIENAHKCGKWVGICGELAADLSLTETFVRMGVDELSVAPSMVLKVRKQIRESKRNPL